MSKVVKKYKANLHKPKQTASQTVFWGIVRGLETHAFVPGQRLIESELGERFGVGRNSVREAMQRLAAEGVVDLSANKGASIRILTLGEIYDLLDIAERLFSLLTRNAVRTSGNVIYQAELKRILEELETADEKRDVAAFASARRNFYRTLLNMGGNVDLKRMFTTIHIPLVYAQQHIPLLQKIRLKDYRRIFDAIFQHDPDLADEAGALHVRNVRVAVQNSAKENSGWIKNLKG